MTKDQLFVRLAAFLRENAMLVADARDSNSPWELLEQLQRFEDASLDARIAAKRAEIQRDNPGVAEWKIAEAGEPPFPER